MLAALTFPGLLSTLRNPLRIMPILTTPLEGLLLLEPKVFGDERGFFLETFHTHRFAAAGLPEAFLQDNHSRSVRGTLRGLHFQQPHAQGKLVTVIRGEIWDAVVDLRHTSPTFGQWYGVTLNDDNHRQLYVPTGFAHGFCVLSDWADVVYKCTEFYHPECEQTLLWNDPAVGIPWPIREPLLSVKDQRGRTLAELPPVR